jgi:hypothetical protein
MKPKRKLVVALVLCSLLAGGWLFANPLGRFGWCCFGYATYNAWPRPISDFQVRADGSARKVTKTHDLSFEQIEWLLTPQPEVLIIALGWDGVTTPDSRIREYKGCDVRRLKTSEAIRVFNRLKRDGKRVAIHYHSTC